ncbi:cysteine dioxygenase type 1 [Helicoverpa zea]|uniref:cysteine dioxygenase type 1 n=1 Tax=Helicoverpa zea TaxID=7113 RepID=UPI001F58F8E9|nr:cysteine dioxygenase type 1 [Helicoverpa zea]
MDVENANCKIKVSQCADMEVLPIERPLKVDVEITGLDILIQELHRMFSCDHVNVQDVQKVMLGYKSNPKDWSKFAKFDRFRYTRNLVDAGNGAFNIMILCWGAGHASAIHDHADSHCFMKLLSGSLEEVRYEWPENVQPEVVKVLNNNKSRRKCCSESQDLPDSVSELTIDNPDDSCQTESCQCDRCQKRDSDRCQNGREYEEGYDVRDMKVRGRTRMEVNDVCYINDALGLHRVENPSHVDGAVSLHLYCPPFDSCRVFDARTGKPTEVKVTFWSMYGKKIKRVLQANEPADSQQ